jgi:excisionase family DNA binding protein
MAREALKVAVDPPTIEHMAPPTESNLLVEPEPADDRVADDPVDDAHRFLRTSEVAALFQVSERAVTDWAARGRLPSVRTPGGHRRYPVDAVRELLERAGLG